MYYSEDSGLTYKEVSIKALDSMPIGSIILFAGQVIPTGWKICDGSVLRVGITQSGATGEYADLYNVIGTTYGYVDYPIPMVGAVDFKLPDLRGRVPVGLDGNDTDFDTLGKTSGGKTHKHTGGSHSHGLANGWACIGTGWDNSNILRQQTKGYINSGNRGMYNMPGYNNTSTSGYDATALGGSTDAGGNVDTTTESSLQPGLVVNYIIKCTNTTPTMASVVNATNNSTEDTYSCSYVNDAVKYALPKMTSGEPTLVGYYGSSKKPVYEYYFNAGKLPNNSSKSFTYSLPNFESILDARFLAYNSTTTLPLPYVNPNLSYNGYWITIEGVTSTGVQIVTGTDRSNFDLWCIIKYVATSEITN